ncbi:hypothetical protein [Paraglaciecola sp.]|uniref:hypothetical protein n=1 Tax=Paraglaciecola sp. TaxID=1920173 RepID=UPI0030F4B2A0
MALQFSGFATLGYSYSDNSDIGFSPSYQNKFDTGGSFTRNSLVGGQVNITLNKNWDSVIQMVLQDRTYKSVDNFLELAFLRFRPSRNWAIRAGRLNSDLYVLSEYVHVGYAYLWIRPPHEFYNFAMPGGHINGADIEYSQSLLDGFLHVKVLAGQSSLKIKDNTEDVFLDFENIMTLSANYIVQDWTFRLSASRANIDSHKMVSVNEFANLLQSIPAVLWPQASSLADEIQGQGKALTHGSLGITYDNQNWLVQSEVGVSESQWLFVPANINAYVSAGYRLGGVTIFAGVTSSKPRHNKLQVIPPQLPAATPTSISEPLKQIVNAVEQSINAFIANQRSFNVGAKWDVSDNLVMKIQFDRFFIQPNGAALWRTQNFSDVTSGHNINVFTVSSSMVF